MRSTILIVDDELSIRESFNLILSDKYKLFLAASGEAAVKYAVDHKIDLTFLDIRMPGIDGIETLKRLKDVSPSTEVIMVTAVNEVQKAAQAVKIGARDYVIKPFDVEAIQKLAADLLTRKSLQEETKKLSHKGQEAGLIGQSGKITEINQLIEAAQKKRGGVLIVGEEGTEKERAARSLLTFGEEFIMLDLKCFRGPQIKKLLLGEKRGQNLIELSKVEGLLDKAGSGALFLDNVELMPADLQETLSQSDFKGRLIFGTTVDLKAAGFNEGLLEKVSETVINIPPIRERSQDLAILLDHFLEKFSQKQGKNFKGFAAPALEALTSYIWPGNYEEMELTVQLLSLTAAGPLIEASDLPLNILLAKESFTALSADEIFSQFEKAHLKQVLDRVSGDRGKASSLLGLNRAVLDSKLQ